jgi:hypothetical protein
VKKSYISRTDSFEKRLLYHLFHLSHLSQIWREEAILNEMRWIFGKCVGNCDINFLGMGELILICTGVVDAMVCPLVMLAP